MNYNKNRNGKDQIWAQEGGKYKTWGHRSDSYSLLLEGVSRAMQHPMGRGGGCSGGLKGQGDRTGGLQGGAGSNGGARSLGGHGRSGDSGGHGREGNLGVHGRFRDSGGNGGSASEAVAPPPRPLWLEPY